MTNPRLLGSEQFPPLKGTEVQQHKVLVVPADVTQPCVLLDVPDDDWAEVRSAATGDPDGTVDFITFSLHRFSVVVDDIGLWKNLPLNIRAMNYMRSASRGVHYVPPVVGDVVFVGHTQGEGDYDDVPEAVLRAAGVTP